ncbi:hypothetical protein ASPCAL04578 [Aspergillus calidoustus]|uniref:Glycoside hydrolase family 39 protein n=1 Tax=Aspergillus calidoustus TaxID=454130 RepID=A0A0U5G1U9_ASPCI|nr:hypothetical protein ASPCAL04578 [Aspergillus calidoustus]
MKLTGALLVALLYAEAIAASSLPWRGLSRRQTTTTATVDLSKTHGPASFLGSGFIYGWPGNGVEAQTSIPDHFATDIRFNACRAGGAQIPAPGWATGGYEGYIGRFNSTLSNYRSTRRYGGDFILLVHDIWGADGGLQGGEAVYPGDGGDWSGMEAYLSQLAGDIVANGMLDGLVLDIWNEPELDIFWPRSWEQFLEYYVRAHRILKTLLPTTLITGPSGAHSPSLDSTTWRTWMSTVAGNNTIPDRYSWHQIGSWEREPDRTIPEFNTLLATYGLPERPIDVNEYAWPSEQNPANSAFYLAQLERYNIRGLRANWGSGGLLHDLMANLLYKGDDGTYYPNGEWQLYRYYAGMTGERVQTTASTDLLFDVFGAVSGGRVKLLAGTRTVQAPYDIRVEGVSSLGLSRRGSVHVRTYRFDWNGPEGSVESPVDLGCARYGYSGDVLTIPVSPPSNSTAFAFEFSRHGKC